ncbi:MAG: pyridoxal phosphate-dependent aminotransferase [Flavisolibacter sp.]
MKIADRLNQVGEYYFSQKLKEIELMNRSGANVINLGIGSPDLPPHPDVIKILQEESANPNSHAYQGYRGVEKLRKAISDWYGKWYGVSLNPATEILPLIGSKEGIMHICMTWLNEGDIALVPNPGYPTYRSAVQLAGGVCYEYLMDETGRPLLEGIDPNDLGKARLMFVNYPHMPTGAEATTEILSELVAFAKKYDILLVSDNPYSFILTSQPQSILSIPGAKEVAVELNSLSKSHNMAGWRVGMLCGSADKIDAVLRFRSNMDSGMFLPVQLAAAKALSLGKDWYDSINSVYRKRKEKAVFLVKNILGCIVDEKQSGLFVWAKVPGIHTSGYALSDEILHEAKVFITPGGIFGSAGDAFIRISLCSKEEKFDEAIERIMAAKNNSTTKNRVL